MFAGGYGPVPGKRAVQHGEAGNACDSKVSPVGKPSRVADAADLIGKQLRHIFLDAIIVRLNDPLFPFENELDETFLANRGQQYGVGLCIHVIRFRLREVKDAGHNYQNKTIYN